MSAKVADWWRAALDVILPRVCPVCGRSLDSDEPHICRGCLAALPRTHLEDVEFNAMEQLFAGKVPIVRATGYFYYEKTSPYSHIVHDIKYRNMPQVARWLGARAVRDLGDSGFFEGIEMIVPVPLHASKQAQRGYNQSDYLAHGLAQELHVPVCHALTARRAHGSQTRRGATARWENARDTYALKPTKLQTVASRHILLVDDVVTTGATLEACARALLSGTNATVSLFTLTTARLD